GPRETAAVWQAHRAERVSPRAPRIWRCGCPRAEFPAHIDCCDRSGAAMGTLTELIQKSSAGDADARNALFAAGYDELRKLARSRLRQGGRNTYLETTALVHESFLRFQRSGELRAEDRRAFFDYASRVMRSVIIDAVRERQASRHGGDLARLT